MTILRRRREMIMKITVRTIMKMPVDALQLMVTIVEMTMMTMPMLLVVMTIKKSRNIMMMTILMTMMMMMLMKMMATTLRYCC